MQSESFWQAAAKAEFFLMQKKPFRLSSRRGFTLIELLVVIAIIALLVSILLPALQKAREQVKKSVCATQEKHWGLSIVQYADDNDQKFPFNLQSVHQWTSKDFREKFIDKYLLFLPKTNLSGKGVKNPSLEGKNNAAFCPSQDRQRLEANQHTSPLHMLIGYFYLANNDPDHGSVAPSWNFTPNGFTDGFDWLNREKLYGKFHGQAPVVSDIISVSGSGAWADALGPFSSHASSSKNDGEPPGGNFLFEDGHVDWYQMTEIDVGAIHSSGGEVYYRVR